MSIGVASVQQKEFTTASAVYYREQCFAAKNAVVVVVVVGQASWPNVWHQRVWNSIWVLEQCLGSGTLSEFWNSVWVLEQYLGSGTMSDIRNWNNNGLALDINRQLSLSAGTQPHSNIITSEYTCICVHIILQCPLQISNISITKDDQELLSNKYNSAAQMFQKSIKVECCNKDVEQFFSSLSVGRNFNFVPHFYKGTPHNLKGVPLGTPTHL